MKLFRCVVLILITTLTVYAGDQNVSIHVTFRNEKPDFLYFNIDPGFSMDNRNLKCKVDSSGTYDLNIEVENSCLVWVAIDAYMCWLMVTPGDDISVTFLGKFYQLPFENNERSSSIIEGDNMLGNVELNKLLRSKYCFCDVHLEIDFSDPENIQKNAQKVFENELSVFNDLLASKNIDKTFYKAISKYLEYVNALAFATTINIHIEKKELVEEEKSKLLRILEQTFDDAPLNDDWALIMGESLDNYSSSYLKYMKYSNPEEYRQQEDAGEKNIYQYQLLKEACSPITFEKIGLQFLWSRTYFGGGKEELDLYNSYVHEYPSTKYPGYRSRMEENIAIVKRQASNEAKALSTDIHFIENLDEIHSLNKLLSKFEGSNLYVDIWATWCGPCLADHRESDLLKKYSEEVGLKLIYISVDSQSKENKWMNYLKRNEIKGYHILASKKLIQNLEQEIPDFGGNPRYLIVSKDGEIVDYNAKRPSDGELLIEQLDEKIGL